MRILVVDDHKPSRLAIADAVEYLGHEVALCGDGEDALRHCRATPVPIVITDLRMPGMGGMELITALKELPRMNLADYIVCTGHGDMDSVIEAMRRGAYDFLTKPVNPRALQVVLGRATEHQSLLAENDALTHRFQQEVRSVTQVLRRELAHVRKRLLEVAGVGDVVAESASMQRILAEAEMYRQDPQVPVLIEGETGTGKEVVARFIHFREDTDESPLVDVNCPAIPPDLFESELFGYASGAFTGSRKEGSPGKLELARGGTLFLDEVGDLPMAMQPKLLRVLETREFYRVGGGKKIPFEGRIVCATNVNLQEAVEAGRFRRDLYHRFHVGHIRIPPLRERKEEIGPLANLFLRRFAKRRARRFLSIHPDTLAQLQTYPWPGNVRELENMIDRAVLMHDADTLRPEHLSFLDVPPTRAGSSYPGEGGSATPGVAGEGTPILTGEGLALPEGLLDLEALNREILRRALEKFGGNKTRTAQYLGLSRGALRNRLDRLEDDVTG